MQHRLLALAVLAFFAEAGHTGPGKNFDEYKAALITAQDHYRSAADLCKARRGNDRDVCKVEAKGDYEVTKARLKERYQPTPAHGREVRVEKAEAQYLINVEKCADLDGSARNVCRRDAVTQYRNAMKVAGAR